MLGWFIGNARYKIPNESERIFRTSYFSSLLKGRNDIYSFGKPQVVLKRIMNVYVSMCMQGHVWRSGLVRGQSSGVLSLLPPSGPQDQMQAARLAADALVYWALSLALSYWFALVGLIFSWAGPSRRLVDLCWSWGPDGLFSSILSRSESAITLFCLLVVAQLDSWWRKGCHRARACEFGGQFEQMRLSVNKLVPRQKVLPKSGYNSCCS